MCLFNHYYIEIKHVLIFCRLYADHHLIEASIEKKYCFESIGFFVDFYADVVRFYLFLTKT